VSLPERLVLATGNAGKLREMREILAPWRVDVRAQSEFTQGAAAETGLTFVENALLKARAVAAATGLPALADEGVICPGDLELIDYAETAEEVWDKIRRFWRDRAGRGAAP
jgi:inosine/xanthosine triphosphate pyrophosphatase family protein